MKSFKLYIVFFLVIGMAISCADENRAFKPKSVAGAFKANGNPTAAPKEGGDGDTDKTQKDQDKDNGKSKAAPLTEADKKLIDDNEQQKLKDFTNNNAKKAADAKKEGDTKVGVTPEKPAATANREQTQAAKAKAISVAEAEEESAYLASKPQEALSTILGVSLSRYVNPNQNKFEIEVLSYIKLGESKETIVSKGLVILPGAEEKTGATSYLNSTIERYDAAYSVDDFMKVRAYCASQASCNNIVVTIVVKTANVYAVGVYLFELMSTAQPNKYNTNIFTLEINNASVGKSNFKSYENALGWAQKPAVDENGTLQPVNAAGGDAQEKEVLTEAQKKIAGDAKNARGEDVEGIGQISAKTKSVAAGETQSAENSGKSETQRIIDETNRAMDAREVLQAEQARVADLESGERVGSVSRSGKRIETGKYGKDYAGVVDDRNWFVKQYEDTADSLDTSVKSYKAARDNFFNSIGESISGWWNGSEKKDEKAPAVDKDAKNSSEEKKEAAAPVVKK